MLLVAPDKYPSCVEVMADAAMLPEASVTSARFAVKADAPVPPLATGSTPEVMLAVACEWLAAAAPRFVYAPDAVDAPVPPPATGVMPEIFDVMSVLPW